MSFLDKLERFTPSPRGNEIVDVGLGRLKRYWPERYDCMIGMAHYWCPFPEVCGMFAAISRTEVLWNPAGMKRVIASVDPEGYAAFIAAHEAGHKFDLDFIRYIDLLDKDVKNQALDISNNRTIHYRNEYLKPKIGFTPFPIMTLEDSHGKFAPCHDIELADKNTKRAIYQILMSDKLNQDQDDDSGDQQDGDSGDQQDDGDSGDGDPDDNSDSKSEDNNDGSSLSDEGKEIAEEAGAKQTKRSMGTLGGNVIESDIPEDSTFEEELAKEEHNIASIVLSNQIAIKEGDTFLSADILEGARAATKQKNGGNPVPWESLLSDVCDNMTDAKWRTPYNHESFVTTGLLMDSRDKPTLGTVAFAFDISMSLTDDQVANQLGRVAEFCASQQFEKVILIPIDDRVGKVVELNLGDSFPDKLQSLGSGCTALDEVFTYIDRENLQYEISALFFFTDGYTTWEDMPQEEPNDYKVVWLDYGQHPDQYIWGERLTVDIG